ncbi:uncharacterized protein LOC108680175 [Hyalella azteca]|uniref:Uncharacterized protein LOC108680175 n=1 Tax=Hyalella azteca TaxID=294128 RepID=A0A8B7PGL0_HYAAZ|nr:uncharacterized protein LOC108680175 [Hyalella azteca]
MVHEKCYLFFVFIFCRIHLSSLSQKDINSATHTTAFLHRLLYDVKQKPQDVPAWKLEQESPFGRTWNLVTGEKHDLQDGRQWQLEDSEGSSISTLDVRWRDVRSAAPEEALPKTISSSLFCPLNSCEARSPATTSESVACKCDPLCSYYGDCCEDSKFRDRGALRHPDAEDRETELGLPPPPDTWLCLESTGATLPYEGVYAVDSCPAESYLEDAMRCELNVAPEQYSPVMDIPVASASAHNLVYRNAFCARCHNENVYSSRFATVVCSYPLRNRQNLSTMTYLKGRRMWTGVVNTSDILEWVPSNNVNVTCALVARPKEKIGRSCVRNVINVCKNSIECPKYLGIVMDANGTKFKNRDCAICNGVQLSDITCPFTANVARSVSPYYGWHRLVGFEMEQGDCSNTENVSDDQSFCSTVQCNPAQVNNSCDVEVIRIKLPKHAPSHISFYCLAITYSINNVTILLNNRLYVNETNEEYRYGEYEVADDGYVRVCRFSDRWTTSMKISFRCFVSLSSLGLILHIFIFIALPKRRNTPSKNLCSLSIALFVSYILLAAVFPLNDNRVLCYASSVFLYYSLISVCFWMNVLSIDICCTFRATLFTVKSHRLFIKYSLYAWIMPLIFASTAIAVDLLTPRHYYLRPEFGTLHCWFNNKWGFFVFYVLPSTIIMIVNMVLYIISVSNIYRQHRAGLAAASTIQKPQGKDVKSKVTRTYPQKLIIPPLEPPDKSQHPNFEFKQSVLELLKCDSQIALDKFKDKMQKGMASRRELKIRLLLYCKLALIMGMTWLVSFVAIAMKSSMAEHIFIIMNGLQGTSIFLAFDCKWKVWNDLVNKFCLGDKNDRSSAGSSVNFASVIVQNTSNVSRNVLPAHVQDLSGAGAEDTVL